MSDKQTSLYVALMGAPNAGKSTLTNLLVGGDVSIVTPKVQTTRNTIRGIAMLDNLQLVLIDTPGIFNPKQRLEKAIVNTAWNGVKSADMLALLVDAKKGICKDTKLILDSLKKENETRNVILILNKVDACSKEKLLPLAQELSNAYNFDQVFMISAMKGQGVDSLTDYFRSRGTETPWCFDPEQLSDMPTQLWAAEVTRGELFMQLQQELPYHIAVQTEQYKAQKDGSIRIDQAIFVTKENQKKMVLGKGGERIKRVSMRVRKQLQESLDTKVHLFLFVKVRKNWLENDSMYRDMGMELP